MNQHNNINMKKLITLVLLGLSVAANARQISPDEAISVASDFMNSSELRTAKSENLAMRQMKAPGMDLNSASSPYYIFNCGENEGFVIISSDDRAPKILGYSDKGRFDSENLPPQLKVMMEQWADQMTKLPESAPQHATWSIAAKTRTSEDVLLETANWGQGFPYNSGCPIIEGANCVTGCVATAMAIVMKYHNWPDTYDWASMPMNTEQDPLDYEVVYPALSGLMSDAGEAVYMEYNPWESGANMNWVGHKMQQEFKYSPDCQFITTAHFSHDEWISLLDSNLNNGYPVVYNGSGSGNHAFVIDGYNSTGYHINWGWDGLYNGYFVLDALTPNEYQDFSNNTGMVMNIIPDKSGIEYSKCFADHGYFWNGGDIGEKMNISVEDIHSGENFTVIWKYITMPEGFNGEIGIALVDSNDNIKEILQTKEVSTVGYEGIGLFDGIFIGNIVNGTVDEDDKIRLVAKEYPNGEYRIILGTLENPTYVPVRGNSPRKRLVTIKVGERVYFDHNDMAENSGVLPYGDTTISVMDGLPLYYRVRSEDSSSTNPVVLKVEGELLYGNIHVSSKEEINYSIDVASDCKIEAYIADLKDAEVNLDSAGSLNSIISEKDGPNIRNLKIYGKMDARDFWYIRDNMPSLESLDLREVSIEEVIGSDENFIPNDDKYSANSIPGWALTNLHSSYISTLILPTNLVAIGSDALVNLEITSVTIPENVNSIGINVFYACHKLRAVELLNPEPVYVNDCIFVDTPCPNDAVLYVPVGSAEKYRQAPVWQDFKEIIEGRMPVQVKTIQLTPDNWSGEEGESFKIEATVDPEDASDKGLVWSSSDESVATVDDDGNVKALAVGEAVILATAADGSGISATCSVSVAAKVIPVESITISKETAVLKVGECVSLTATVLPDNATDKKVIWSSDNPSVATVDAEGNVTAISIGTANVTVMSGDCSANCAVNVIATMVESIILTPDNWSGEEGESFKIEAVVMPVDATDNTLVWSSSDESIATVDSEGNVAVLKVGTCVITASAADGSGIYAECVILSVDGVDGIFSESETVDIYSVNGVLIEKCVDRNGLKVKSPGIYIVRQGDVVKKVVVR